MSSISASPAPRRQLSRTALLYFFAAFSACALLLAIFMPWWLLPVAGSCLLWRFLVFTGRLSFPSVWLKSALVLLSGVALFQQYGFSISLDVFVMLLLLGFSLKLLELYYHADAQIFLYLSFFVLMTVFLFDQTPLYVLLVFAATLLVLAAMVAIQSADNALQQQRFQPLRVAGLVFTMALPVMLFMFVVMPRLPPLWAMPLQKQQQAKTGMSDSMTPGDIASLARSGDLVFRASFPDGVPDRRNLYWYGLVFDHFDGQSWTDSCRDCRENWSRTNRLPVQVGAGKPYQVILEPQGNSWLYVLNPSRINDPSIWMNTDNIFRYDQNVHQTQFYQARYIEQPVPFRKVLYDESRYLALPAGGNPQSRALAQQWKAGNANARAVIQKAMAFYHESFSYTLQPPALGEQRIDGFLFATRRGFCEHFASSFVFLMRAAGIPARVVVGYLGGEIHEPDHYVVVRQYDAHAWAEVWLPDAGWTRVDPTAAVAPERVDLSFADAFAGNPDFAGNAGLGVFRRVSFLNSLRLQFDRFDYLWARWVLGYEGDQQEQLLKKIGLVSPLRIAVWGGGSVVLVFVLLCIYLYWREWWSSHEPPATRRYRQLCHAYALCGVERLPAETPVQYAEKVTANSLPCADVFSEISQQYYRWVYCSPDLLAAAPSENFMARSRQLYWRLLFHAFRSK
jgi:protein-glutamine gamma-glutamyltransferase